MSKGWCLGDVGFASEACSLSQRPHMNFHDFHVISAHTGLASPVSIGALLFSDSLFSCPGRDSVIHRLTAAKMGGGGGDYSAKTVLICIFTIIHEPQTLRSCDLYLHKESGPGKRSPCPGCVVCPSAVSSDSRHASSGNLCTSCVDPWSVSTSKLSCCLSLPHSFVLISLSVFSHFTECTLHCHRSHLGAGSQCFVSAFSVLSLPPACILCWTEFTASVGGTYRGAILLIDCLSQKIPLCHKPVCIWQQVVY